MNRKTQRVPIAVAFLALFAAACNSPDGAAVTDPQPTAVEATAEGQSSPVAASPTVAETAPSAPGVELPAIDPASVTGDIATAGSSTVQPLSEYIVDSFRGEGYAGEIALTSVGTGAGFERFCNVGEIDIANASRPIKDEERTACQAIGREPVEFRVATDALAVAVSVENDFVDSLTTEELAAVFSTAVTWADVRPEWPAEPIERFSPGEDSGTYDYFVEHVFDKDPQPLLDAKDLQLSEDDNVLVQGVAGSPYAIGYFGYAYAEENQGVVRPVAIDGVEPSAETVDDGTYPLSRPLMLYTTAEIMREKPQVASFIGYYLIHADEAAETVGYFPLSDEAIAESRSMWLQITGQ